MVEDKSDTAETVSVGLGYISGLAVRVMTQTCQPVTILAGSNGHDSELPASYHRGTAMMGQAEKKQLMGSGENVTESTPLGINSFYFVDYDIFITVLHGAVRP